MAKLTAKSRSNISKSNFAIPQKAKTASAKKKSGNYPIPDKGHAKAALSLVSQHGSAEQKKEVRAAVKKKFPDMGAAKKAGRARPKPKTKR